jgi:hypothetical protein
MSVSTCKTVQCHNPEHYPNHNHHINLKSYKMIKFHLKLVYAGIKSDGMKQNYIYLMFTAASLYQNLFLCFIDMACSSPTCVCFVHSVQQKSSGLIFRTYRSRSHVTYSCHHNSSHFSFPIFVNSWRFSVFHSLQSIMPHIY